jgi:hypothetical protein
MSNSRIIDTRLPRKTECCVLLYNISISIFYATIFFKNKNISKKLKLNTITDKMLTYASGTWTLTKRERKQLNVFKGKCIEEF